MEEITVEVSQEAKDLARILGISVEGLFCELVLAGIKAMMQKIEALGVVVGVK